MIYWPTTPDISFDIAIPNQYGLEAGDISAVQFIVQNNVGLQVYPSGDFNVDEVTPLWITLHLNNDSEQEQDFPPDGEYTYKVYDAAEGGRLLSAGLLVFGNYHAPHTDYETTTEYEQYDGK